MTREESNKLIAEFETGMEYIDTNFAIVDPKGEDLRYHTSWDWLIPAWHKWITMCWDDGLFTSHPVQNIYEEFNTRVARNAPNEAMEFLVQGIKWHNQQEKS